MNLRFTCRNKPVFSCWLVALLAALFLVAGCDRKEGVRTGDTAPSFSGTDINGRFFSLGQTRGNVVVLYFWASSCCGDRLKQLQPFYEANRSRGLTVLAINVGDTRERVAAYVRGNSLTFPFQVDDHRMVANQYGVYGFPTVFLLDRNGVIRKRIVGSIPPEALEKLVSDSLAPGAANGGPGASRQGNSP